MHFSTLGLLLLSVSCFQTPVLIYVGYSNNEFGPITVPAYTDISFNSTIISINHFDCSAANSCVLGEEIVTTKIQGKKVTYRPAKVSLNLVQKAFKETMNVIYLTEDPEELGTILGLREKGDFFSYYEKQNSKDKNRVIFSLNSNNLLSFRAMINEANYEEILYVIPSKVKFSNSTASLPMTDAKICLTNRIDRYEKSVYFGVPSNKVDKWRDLIKNGSLLFTLDPATDPMLYSVGFDLMNGNTKLGHVAFSFTEMMVNGSPSVIELTDTSDFDDGCDLYTGSLFLRRYNFQFVYAEYTDMEMLYFTFDSFLGSQQTLDQRPTYEENSKGFWLKILIFLGVIAMGGFFAYRYIRRRRRILDNYQGHFDKEDEIYEMGTEGELRELDKNEKLAKN